MGCILSERHGGLCFEAMNDPRHFYCPACHRINRVSGQHLGKSIRCGDCGNMFQATTVVHDVNTTALERLVSNSPVPLLVDFWADWCAPCHAFMPQLESFAVAQKGRALVAKLSIDDNPLAVEKYKVQSVPTLGLWSEGNLMYLQPGIMTASQLHSLVAPYRRYVV